MSNDVFPASDPPLFEAPALEEREEGVIARVQELRQQLRHLTRQPRRWVGTLRRVSLARAIRASNSIEGYNVSLDDAVAVAEGQAPQEAEGETAAVVRGYRDAMTYIVQLADDASFRYDESLLRGLHFMMIQDDLTKRPGLYRLGSIFVRDGGTGENVYEAPPAEDVPTLMAALVRHLDAQTTSDQPAIVRAAMAHLNLVMVHPFKDGNGRMARALQSLVLARDGILEPPFSSVEEHLGRNAESYYRVLAQVGGGTWQPHRDTRPWIRFMLTAHLRQATTLLRRADDYEQLWERLSDVIGRQRLNERTVTALADAAMGFRVTNGNYRVHEDIGAETATRDLKEMVARGLLVARGEKRGRHYVAADELRGLWTAIRSHRRVDDQVDPFAPA